MRNREPGGSVCPSCGVALEETPAPCQARKLRGLPPSPARAEVQSMACALDDTRQCWASRFYRAVPKHAALAVGRDTD